MPGMENILFEQQGGLAIATLNRPDALNAVNLAMYRAFAPVLAAWGTDPGVGAAVLQGAGPKAFCAGGDVRAIYQARGRPLVRGEYAYDMFREEYIFIRGVHRFPKPWIALAHGICMGGGAGLSVNGSFRVVTETTSMAMPEVFIGSLPDVGATRFLSACPGRIGVFLALTGARVGAADALYCGLATHFVPQKRLGELVSALAAVPWQRGEEFAQAAAVLANFNASPGEPTLPAIQPAIDRCFGQDSVEEIVAALKGTSESWAQRALAAVNAASPLSLKLAFRQVSHGAGLELELERALVTEFRIIQHLLAGADFYQGVRAVLIEKEKKPRWSAESLEQVSAADVERHYESLGARELSFAA